MRIRKSETLKQLLAQEDTDGSRTITVDDTGPKSFTLTAANGETLEVKGTYRLANLLQEIWLGEGEIDPEKIFMPPLARVEHLMRNHYWQMLSRRMDQENILANLSDEKRTSDKAYLYVPAADTEGLAYYRGISAAHPEIEIVELGAPPFSDGLLAEIDRKPGLLALKYDAQNQQPLPYVVPGGRFNEMYGWDSYFIALGLMAHDQYELARGMLENTAYQIRYYGKMLNANRSYYLTRSQPPFYTAYLDAFYRRYRERLSESWLREHLAVAIDEYHNVWMNPHTRYFPEIGLNHYFDEGGGRPKETETGHFDFVLQHYAEQHGLSVAELEHAYDQGRLEDAGLDRYFRHDRAMRESGHDTTTRLDKVCADTACVDLNAILYRTENDIAALIADFFPQGFVHRGRNHTAEYWRQQAAKRHDAVQKYLWNEADGTFYDYNAAEGKPNAFVSATNLLPLWAGLCSPQQAGRLVKSQLGALLRPGGIASTGPLDGRVKGPDRQWDHPYGWAPHQILIWEGLERYGFQEEMQKCAFAWVKMIIRTTVGYNGLIPEKFNVEKGTHKTDVEYGNVGAVFEYVPAGGFGWTNASLIIGISKLSKSQKDELDKLPESID